MLWLYRFFNGFVHIIISGNYSERLLNVCAGNGISVWNTRKRKDSLHAYIFARDFKRLLAFRGKSGVKIHIAGKTGFPFIVHKYKKRPGIAVGMILFFVLINFLSGFIWNISVTGNSEVSTESILAACEQLGIAEGAKKGCFKPQDARVELVLLTKGISWASINEEGTRVTINVRETVQPQSKDTVPCNLKSCADGIIISTAVTKGDVCVKPGDTVVAGQLLVSGAMELPDGSTGFVHSEGEIIAQTVRTLSSTVKYEQTKKVRSGKKLTRRVLNFFGCKIPLYLGGVKAGYDREVSVNKIITGDNYVPVYITTANFYETLNIKETYTRDEALRMAKKSIKHQISEYKNCELQSYEEAITENKEGITVLWRANCRENIITVDILMIDTFN